MKARHLTVALLGAVLFAGSAGIAHADINWVRSVKTAQERAVRENKPVMIDCYTTWCGWCKKLDAESFRDANVGQLAQSFVSLKVDAEAEGAGIAQQYQVDGYPTILFLDASGKVLNRIGGYVDGPTLASEMQRVLALSGARGQASRSPGTSPQVRQTTGQTLNTAKKVLTKAQLKAMEEAYKQPKKAGGALLKESKQNSLVAQSDGIFLVVDDAPEPVKAKKKPVSTKTISSKNGKGY